MLLNVCGFLKSELEDQGDLEQLKQENCLCDSVHIQRKKGEKRSSRWKPSVNRENIWKYMFT